MAQRGGDPKNATDFGRALRRHRKARGWTLDELARRVNEAGDATTHDKGTVGRWERGPGEPTPTNQALILRALEIESRDRFFDILRPMSIDRLLDGADPETWEKVKEYAMFLRRDADTSAR